MCVWLRNAYLRLTRDVRLELPAGTSPLQALMLQAAQVSLAMSISLSIGSR